MLKVTIELHSANDGSRKVLSELLICNDASLSDGSGDSEFGSYDVTLFPNGAPKPGVTTVQRFRVEIFPRKLGALELVRRVIGVINGGEKMIIVAIDFDFLDVWQSGLKIVGYVLIPKPRHHRNDGTDPPAGTHRHKRKGRLAACLWNMAGHSKIMNRIKRAPRR